MTYKSELCYSRLLILSCRFWCDFRTKMQLMKQTQVHTRCDTHAWSGFWGRQTLSQPPCTASTDRHLFTIRTAQCRKKWNFPPTTWTHNPLRLMQSQTHIKSSQSQKGDTSQLEAIHRTTLRGLMPPERDFEYVVETLELSWCQLYDHV